MFEIIPNLYLSSYHSVIITSNTFIVNCTKNLDMLNDNNIRIPVNDDGSIEAMDTMVKLLPDIIELIDAKLKENQIVVVHCLAGQQRSPAVIAAYLMTKHGYSLKNAMDHIKSIKKDAFFWTCNFQYTLEQFTF
ncbi:dual specificity protein phosphatase family protein [Flavobacterium sp.]|uniref:dual specificity protein phosphatase family protein n=1 Tax=Flavobacterium sp. TaxID=239 RepID=UPI0037BF0CB9